jgi:uncharacterized protein (TIGR02145 family)
MASRTGRLQITALALQMPPEFLRLYIFREQKIYPMKKILLTSATLCIAFTVFGQWACGDSLIDPRDGKAYPTILIGSDCWMAQNLNYGQYVASTTSSVQHSDCANDGNVQKYCQNNDSMYCITYGGLYDWHEMMDYTTTNGTQGICPPGWHVATDAEWTAMIFAAGGSVSGHSGIGANAMKAIGTGQGAGVGTNTSGFSAMPGGDRDGLGVFYGITGRYIFWTSTMSTSLPWQYTFWDNNDSIYRWEDAGFESGFSCRCVYGNTSGMQDLQNGSGFKLIPNPAHDRVMIMALKDGLEKNYRVFDVTGKEVMHGTFYGESTELDLTTLTSGIYMIRMEWEHSSSTQRVIVD